MAVRPRPSIARGADRNRDRAVRADRGDAAVVDQDGLVRPGRGAGAVDDEDMLDRGQRPALADEARRRRYRLRRRADGKRSRQSGGEGEQRTREPGHRKPP